MKMKACELSKKLKENGKEVTRGAIWSGGWGYSTNCPTHRDTAASLQFFDSVYEGTEYIRFKCRAGCTHKSIKEHYKGTGLLSTTKYNTPTAYNTPAANKPIMIEAFVKRLRALGITVTQSGQWYSTQCPTHEDRNPSLSFKECIHKGYKYIYFYCFADCAHRDIKKYYTDKGLLPATKHNTRTIRTTHTQNTHPTHTEEKTTLTDKQLEIWNAGRSIEGTPAERHFTNYRGFEKYYFEEHFIYRCYPFCRVRYSKEKRALVARYTTLETQERDDTVQALELYYLHEDGTPNYTPMGEPKYKRSLGTKRGAVWKATRTDLYDTLILCEGIADALATTIIEGINDVGVVAIGGITNIPRSIPSHIKEICLCFDNDDEGKKATQKAKDLYLSKGLTVRVHKLPKQYKDIAEHLAEHLGAMKKKE